MRRRSHLLVAALLATGESFALAQSPAAAPRQPAADPDVEVPSAPAPAGEPRPADAAPTGADTNPRSAEDEAQRARQAELEARVRTLETRLDAAVARSAPPPAPPPPPPPRPSADVAAEGDPRGEGGDAGVSVLPRPGFLFSGYAQGQFFSSADSVNSATAISWSASASE